MIWCDCPQPKIDHKPGKWTCSTCGKSFRIEYLKNWNAYLTGGLMTDPTTALTFIRCEKCGREITDTHLHPEIISSQGILCLGCFKKVNWEEEECEF